MQVNITLFLAERGGGGEGEHLSEQGPLLGLICLTDFQVIAAHISVAFNRVALGTAKTP